MNSAEYSVNILSSQSKFLDYGRHCGISFLGKYFLIFQLRYTDVVVYVSSQCIELLIEKNRKTSLGSENLSFRNWFQSNQYPNMENLLFGAFNTVHIFTVYYKNRNEQTAVLANSSGMSKRKCIYNISNSVTGLV